MKRSYVIGLMGLLLLLGGAAAFFILRGNDNAPAPIIGAIASDAIKITIVEEGFHQIRRDDLAEVGLTLSELQEDNLSLRQGETAVPYLLHNDSLIFYGQASTDPYTAVRTYILETGHSGTAIAEQSVDITAGAIVTDIPQTIHLEENSIYEAEARSSDVNNDLWLWQDIPQQDSFAISISLPTISNLPATLRTELRGVTYNNEIENDHDIDLIINQQTVETIRFDGATYFTSTVNIPSSILQAGNNDIQFDNSPEGASFLDIIQLNWVSLTYFAAPTAVNDFLQFSEVDGTLNLAGFSEQPLIFDTTDPTKPQHLINWPYSSGQAQLSTTPDRTITAVGPLGFHKPFALSPLRTSQWKNDERQADLIIITSDLLTPALEPLVEAREQEGLRVALVPVDEVYDAFGHGTPSPESLQRFVKYAHENWADPKPRYLFLVGDATTDYHDNFGLAPESSVPTFLVPVVYGGETASDSRLADIDNDMQPDMAVGRWPVNTVAEVESLVARTLAYEQGNAAEQVLFAADDTEPRFADLAANISTAVAFKETAVNILDGPQASEVAAAWNEGTWLTTYVGHGSINQWGKEEVFTLDAVSQLSSSSPPIVVQLTCLSGLFAHPEQTSLSETMLTHEQGPVLLVAATSLTLSSNQRPFAVSLFENLQDSQVERVGDAFQAAKLSLDLSHEGLREISDTFALFGDPSAHIVRPQG